jgi:hypothetical protein
MINPPRNMNQHIRKNEARGRGTDVAVVFGADPVVGLTAVTPFPYGVDELAVAGGIRGEPIEGRGAGQSIWLCRLGLRSWSKGKFRFRPRARRPFGE